MFSKIIFNGKEYNSVEEMPAEARQAYESMMGIFADKDQNGIPDIMEGKGDLNTQIIQPMSNVAMQSRTIVYDGKTYNDVNEPQPEARAKYEQAMGMFADKNQDGMPDMLEHVLTATSVQTMRGTSQAQATSPLSQMPYDPMQADSGGRTNKLLSVGMAVAVLLIIVAALLAVLVFKAFAPLG